MDRLAPQSDMDRISLCCNIFRRVFTCANWLMAYPLYSTNLDHLSNDAENFGGQMTEIHVQ